MLWRVRTTLPDRPGALALLAEHCGLADINILGLQIFPGMGAVTDELVLRSPPGWDAARIAGLVESSGGTSVLVLRCTEAALSDQPTRYIQAARAIVEQPTTFPEVVARLFDAAAEPSDRPEGDDVMELAVGAVVVLLHREVPFTATEHARGAAIAALVSDALTRAPEAPSPVEPTGSQPSYVVAGDDVRAMVDGVVVGRAFIETPLEALAEDGLVPVSLRVDPAWQRRGIGTRLLVDVARLAQSRGAGEVLLRTGSENPAVLPMVLAAGLRGRIRMAGDELTVRVPVRELRPLPS